MTSSKVQQGGGVTSPSSSSNIPTAPSTPGTTIGVQSSTTGVKSSTTGVKSSTTTNVSGVDLASKRIEWLHKLRSQGSDWESLLKLRLAFLKELQRGLKMHKKDPSRWRPEESDLMCLDCCLPKEVLGTTDMKAGIYYGLDFGGSNIRFMRGKISSSSSDELHFSQRVSSLRDGNGSPAEHLPKGLLDPNATATMLFDFVAEQLKNFMESNGDLIIVKNNPEFLFPLGFTFSFGFTQEALDSTPLHQWSKDFETGNSTQDPVVGSDICLQIRNAFTRKNVPAKLIGIMNDTAAVLLAANLQRCAIDKYAPSTTTPPTTTSVGTPTVSEVLPPTTSAVPSPLSPSPLSPPCRIGLIFGTGVNGCYFEPDAMDYGYKGFIINTECGGLNHLLPYTEVDEENDKKSSNIGSQRLEKIISGHYLPEIIRNIILKTFNNDILPSISKESHTLTCPGMARIFNLRKNIICDCDSNIGKPDKNQTKRIYKSCQCLNNYGGGDYRKIVQEIFVQEWNWQVSLLDCEFLYDIIEAVWLRSCRMAGMIISGLVEKTKDITIVGVDGSLFNKCDRFREEVTKITNQLNRLAKIQPVELRAVRDGSGIGAVALAALFNTK